MADVTHDPHGDHHDHPPYLAHHFDTPVQQFDSGKLGMWLFLATEVLFFGGLFCLYVVYRSMHPEMFWAGHIWLDPFYGALNTAILITSSLTMAWAVRAAQLSQQRLMMILLGITFLCACGFMVVKGIEYYSKWKHGIGYGWFELAEEEPHGKGGHGATGGDVHAADAHTNEAPASNAAAKDAAAMPAGRVPDTLKDLPQGQNLSVKDASQIEGLEVCLVPAAGEAPGGVVPDHKADAHAGYGEKAQRFQVRTFFMIYFSMTGLHGIHVLAGMVAIAWIMWRGALGQFNADYFTPVDLVGLYWHLVDLIWIFLFPMLYLIH
jgi:cytochrome c oxidase subunit 3